MKVLYVAPHPFYRERGTPIATRLMVETLLDLGHEATLLVYHEGADVELEGLKLHRISGPPGLHDVPIGLSLRKLVCDVWLAVAFMKLVRRQRFDVIHAGKEGAYLAYLLRQVYRRPYLVDMDSSLPDQIQEGFPQLGPWFRPLRELDRCTKRQAVTAVGEHLAQIARRARDGQGVHVIRDVADFGGGRDGRRLPRGVTAGRGGAGATRTVRGSAGPTRTPMAYCASICRRGPTSPATPSPSWMRSRASSTRGLARHSAIGRRWIYSRKPLHQPVESARQDPNRKPSKTVLHLWAPWEGAEQRSLRELISN